ncbi:Leucyl-tRNA synthetase [Mycoplasma suis KI3806]|uniref:leucine--tRNA ligase n=1 Tax=Mycoplasma suis (strain KI_3806) TaxID=708248 RepID=F0V3I3_MYCS3|nr:class I tRNA ligase family protein [Mycoplasma suis]CBZ40405.1 Leucyl-tRNA synthetase [Mycoplasma suis KI3806]
MSKKDNSLNWENDFPRWVEKKWVNIWEKEQTYKFEDDLSKPKFYVLDMFPYPSGAGLHIGHVKGYLASDIVARYKKMKGFSVLHPMGWDSFGLPAEQYAIQNKADPSTFTEKNISRFREELKSLFFSYDFQNKEINSSDSSYYAITQWLFLQLYRRGLATLENKQVNWVEELHTVLANEEIYEGEDGKFYSERGNFPVTTRKLKQWVLKITKYAQALKEDLYKLEWTDRIKKIQEEWIGEKEAFKFELKIKGKSFEYLEENIDDVRAISGFYIYKDSEIFRLLELDYEPKDGDILFYYNDDQTLDRVPIKFREGENISEQNLHPIYSDFIEKKRIPSFLNWKVLPKVKTYKLQDWVFSRQRYWGEPFPVYYDKEGHIFLEENLPLKLPPFKFIENTKKYDTPLAYYEDWVNFKEGFRRDINTMPNWAASSWYFLAYLIKKGDGYLPLNSKEAIDLIERWMPVDLYIGGQEHATMHLIYARFWYKVIHSVLNLKTVSEPFKKLVNQGMILGSDGKKMSKSKNNYLSVESLLESFGGDVIRLSVAFLGPLELTQYWDDRQLSTFESWIKKIYSYYHQNSSYFADNIPEKDNSSVLEFIKKVEFSIQSFKFNVLVSELMIFFNYLKQQSPKSKVDHSIFIQFLSYLAPSIAEEIWRELLGNKESVYLSSWPNIEEGEKSSFFSYSIQLNNKFKGTIDIPKDLRNEEEIINYLKSSEKGSLLLKDKQLNKYIVVYGKIINLITSSPS